MKIYLLKEVDGYYNGTESMCNGTLYTNTTIKFSEAKKYKNQKAVLNDIYHLIKKGCSLDILNMDCLKVSVKQWLRAESYRVQKKKGLRWVGEDKVIEFLEEHC